MTDPTPIPAGYRRNAQGHLVPEAKIKPLDLQRDALVTELADQAVKLSTLLAKFKARAFADVAAHVEVAAEEYGAKLRGTKGNVTLLSFDGRYKVERRIHDVIRLDERLMAAKALVDECIKEWIAQGNSAELEVLVNDAFRVDKEGAVSLDRVLGLRRHNIKTERWLRAMDAIADAVHVVGSRSYIRVWERVGDTDEYRAVPLSVSGA
ncbi:MAG: DUF3164 family protein [Aquincola sp.]|nr:DUF3164 family protein [Aquincola sp.]